MADATTSPSPASSVVHRHPTAAVHEELGIKNGPLSLPAELDPFGLQAKIKTEDEIKSISANTSRKRTGMQKFYTEQNESIERLLKPVHEHGQDVEDSQEATNVAYKIAVYGSLTASFVLAGLQLYAAITSASLSIVTTMVDSIFDPFSNTMLLLSHRAINRVNIHRWPTGRARLETAANITFSFIMISVSLIIIVQAIIKLIEGSDSDFLDFNLGSIIAVAVAFGTKLGLFFYCFTLRKTYSQVEILWQDHRNDLFINGFGILTSVGGSKIKWFIDPMGAILLSTLIIVLWSKTAFQEFKLLIGVSADQDFLQLVTYICEKTLCPTPLVYAH